MNHQILFCALLLAAAPWASLAQTTFTVVANSPIAQDASYGMSWVDYDNDGFIDLHSCGPFRNLLYHNEGGVSFSRIGSTNALVARIYPSDYAEAGYWADYDNDGLTDVIIPTGQQGIQTRNQLFRNLGDGRFVFVTNVLSTNLVSTFSAAWADFNCDGLLDIFLANYGKNSTSVESQFYVGTPGGSFERLQGDGIPSDLARRFTATVADFNNDGWPDLVIGTNPGQSIVLYQNRDKGSAFDVSTIASGGNAVIGGAWGDYDNDGNLDLFAAYAGTAGKLLHNLGLGNGGFEQIFEEAVPHETGGAYAAAWGDYDNDGWLDLFVPRNSVFGGTDNRDSLWQNNGDGTFTRVSAETIGEEAMNSWGAAWGDFKNDGFLDLVVGRQDSNNSAVKNRLFRNNGNANHWIVFKLVGTTSNRSALGAKVRVKATIQGRTLWQMREIGAGAVCSQNDLRAHFGLGDATQVEELRIEWPSGQVTTTTNVASKQFLLITEPKGQLRVEFYWPWENAAENYARVFVKGDLLTPIILESSIDLRTWTEVGRGTLDLQGEWTVNVGYPDRTAASAAFYRARMP